MGGALTRIALALGTLAFVACAAPAPADPAPTLPFWAETPDLPSLDEARVSRVDPLRCTERIALPQFDNVTTATWSPDGGHLALTRIVTIPSRKTPTGFEEDPRLEDLDLRTGKVVSLGEGSKQAWSGNGTYLSFWHAGVVTIEHGGTVVAQIDTSMPDTRWAGDQLLYWSGNEIRGWSANGDRAISTVDRGFVPRYPYDDASFSADGQLFTLTRYHMDGSASRYIGETLNGQIAPLGTPGATYTEWSPVGRTLLVRSNTEIELRGSDGWDRVAPLSMFPGTVHSWAANGKDLVIGAITATVPGGNAFDTFAVWDGDTIFAKATLPNLLGARSFSPDGRHFAGVVRNGLYGLELAVFACGTPERVEVARAEPAARARALSIAGDSRRFVRPVAGLISGFFTRTHPGVDVAAPIGSVITADDEGVVTFVGWHPYGGRAVCVDHGSGLESCFYHTSLAYVTTGERVARGQPVAAIGLTGLTTGPHVHWEVKRNGVVVDPLTH